MLLPLSAKLFSNNLVVSWLKLFLSDWHRALKQYISESKYCRLLKTLKTFHSSNSELWHGIVMSWLRLVWSIISLFRPVGMDSMLFHTWVVFRLWIALWMHLLTSTWWVICLCLQSGVWVATDSDTDSMWWEGLCFYHSVPYGWTANLILGAKKACWVGQTHRGIQGEPNLSSGRGPRSLFPSTFHPYIAIIIKPCILYLINSPWACTSEELVMNLQCQSFFPKKRTIPLIHYTQQFQEYLSWSKTGFSGALLVGTVGLLLDIPKVCVFNSATLKWKFLQQQTGEEMQMSLCVIVFRTWESSAEDEALRLKR